MFYDKLKELCENKGVKPSRVAIECGFSKGTVSHWKNEGTIPQREILIKIAEYFDVSIDYLLGNEPKEQIFEGIKARPTLLKQNIKTLYDNAEPFVATNHEMKMILEYRNKPEIQQQVNRILNKENPTVNNDEALMFALWEGDTDIVDEEMIEDVKDFAKLLAEKKKRKMERKE